MARVNTPIPEASFLEPPREEDFFQLSDAMLLYLAQKRINSSECLDQNLSELNELVTQALCTERASIWFYDESKTTLCCHDLFEASSGQHSSGVSIALAMFPDYLRAIHDSRSIAVTDAQIDPRTREFSSSYLAARNITSILNAGIWVNGSMIGVVSAAAIEKPRQWQQCEQQFMIAIADSVAQWLNSAATRQNQNESPERIDFKSLAVSLFRACRSLAHHSLEDACSEALRLISHYCKADRAFLILSPPPEPHEPEAFEWSKTKQGRFAPPDKNSFESFLKHLGSSNLLWAPDLTRPAVGMPLELRLFHSSPGKSLLCLPLYHAEDCIGCVGVEFIQAHVAWSETFPTILEVAGAFLVTLLEQAHTEEALAEQRRFFRKVIDINPNFIFAKNRAGRFVLVNQAVANAYGATVEELIGKTDADFNPSPEEVAHFLTDDAEVLDKLSEKYIPEETITDAQGNIRYLQTVKRPIISRDGKAELVLGVSTDITERKRADEEQRRLQLQMQHTQKLESLGVLAGGIAHDFNNLLMGILGTASLLEQEPNLDSTLVREQLAHILTAARRASELTNQLLAYSGRGSFLIELTDVNYLVREMSALLERVISKKATLRYRLHKNPPTVMGDATQLRQVLMNLLTNASDALGDRSGEITIRTSIVDLDEEMLAKMYLHNPVAAGTFVRLDVQDSGIGMDEGTVNRIFDPFFTTKFTGRGLGLAAVLGIVRSHQGALAVKTTLGEGTTFKVFLPFVKQSKSDLEHLSAKLSHAGEHVSSAALKNKPGKVLLVDDEELTLSVTQAMLEYLGFEVVTARDGIEALERLRLSPQEYLFVLLDMTMPRMDGEETLSHINAIDPSLPVILTSGYTEHDAAGRFQGKPFSAFLQKPYTTDALRRMLAKVLG